MRKSDENRLFECHYRAHLEIRSQLLDFLEALLHGYVRIDVINSVDKTERLSVGNAAAEADGKAINDE